MQYVYSLIHLDLSFASNAELYFFSLIDEEAIKWLCLLIPQRKTFADILLSAFSISFES